MNFKKILSVLFLVGLVTFCCAFSGTDVSDESLRDYCLDNHINYELVKEVDLLAKDKSGVEIADYFIACSADADTYCEVEPVDAICNVLNCSVEEALIILD